MPEATEEILRRAAATANRLRLVQVDFADESAEIRSEYLCEELEQALAAMVPEERQVFLKELMARFPLAETKVGIIPRDQEAAGGTAAAAEELQDANFLVARLVEVAPSLSESERQALTARLREAGLAPGAGVDWPREGRSEVSSGAAFGR